MDVKLRSIGKLQVIINFDNIEQLKAYLAFEIMMVESITHSLLKLNKEGIKGNDKKIKEVLKPWGKLDAHGMPD